MFVIWLIIFSPIILIGLICESVRIAFFMGLASMQYLQERW